MDEIRYYFYYFEIPKIDYVGDGILKTSDEEMHKVIKSAREYVFEQIDDNRITVNSIIFKQFNRL